MARASLPMASPYDSAARSWCTRRGAPLTASRRRRAPAGFEQELLQRLAPPGLEVGPLGEGERAMLQLLDFELEPRDLEGQVVQEVRAGEVDLGLPRERGHQRRRIPEQLLDRSQHAPDRLQRSPGPAAAA